MSNITLNNNNISLQEILESVNQLPSVKREQEKFVEITENGIISVIPDDGKTLSKVNITTIIESGKEEQEKTINTQAYEDKTVIINPDEGKTLSKVTVNIDVKDEQEKSIEITSKGTQVVLPDDGKTLSRVTVVTNIEGGGSGSEDYLTAKETLSLYSNSNLSRVEDYAFAGCPSLTSINLPVCNQVGSYAFAGCPSLTSIDLPACTSIGPSAFYSCSSLTSIDLPACTRIGPSAFYSCTSLTSINLPVCTSVGAYAFYSCPSLTSIDLPICTYIGPYTFYSCTSLTSINLPVCTSISHYTFQYCTSLTSINLPACSQINGYGAFMVCSSLTSVNLPVCNLISNSAFYNCHLLTSLTLRNSNVARLVNIDAFASTPMSVSTYTGSFGSIYVPASLVEAYKTATNWITYKDRITAITEISNIDDIIIPLHTTKICKIRLDGFTSSPENITIVPNDVNKCSISDIQSDYDNITFNITSYDSSGELKAVVTAFYNGIAYTKTFNIIILASPIGDVEISPLNIGESRTISIPWYGNEPATSLSVVSSDTDKLSVSNIQASADNISFDIASLNEIEGEVDIIVTVIYNNRTYTNTNKIIIDTFAAYTVIGLDTNYTFVLNDNGYYESNNKGKDNTYAMCKVNIKAPEDCKMYVDCINYAESSYDFGILSNLNTELSFSTGEDGGASVKKSFKGLQMATVQTVEYDIPAGNHFIYVKFRKDISQSTNYDSLQFKIRFE